MYLIHKVDKHVHDCGSLGFWFSRDSICEHILFTEDFEFIQRRISKYWRIVKYKQRPYFVQYKLSGTSYEAPDSNKIGEMTDVFEPSYR